MEGDATAQPPPPSMSPTERVKIVRHEVHRCKKWKPPSPVQAGGAPTEAQSVRVPCAAREGDGNATQRVPRLVRGPHADRVDKRTGLGG